MSDDEGALTPREREQRRRRLAEVFGGGLPEQTRDDADAGAGTVVLLGDDIR